MIGGLKRNVSLDKIQVNNRVKNFDEYKGMFENLTETWVYDTNKGEISSVLINESSEYALAVIQMEHELSLINVYPLNGIDTSPVLSIELKGEYIKCQNIEQNQSGDLFASAYMDDGNWYLLIFDIEKELVRFDINSHFGIDNNTIPIAGFTQPFATCCFMSDDEIYYNFFYKDTKTHYQFTYCPKEKCVKQDISSIVIEQCTVKNFPNKVFYNAVADELHAFYRQGLSFEIDAKDINKAKFEKITDYDLGDMLMYKDQVLIARSS